MTRPLASLLAVHPQSLHTAYLAQYQLQQRVHPYENILLTPEQGSAICKTISYRLFRRRPDSGPLQQQYKWQYIRTAAATAVALLLRTCALHAYAVEYGIPDVLSPAKPESSHLECGPRRDRIRWSTCCLLPATCTIGICGFGIVERFVSLSSACRSSRSDLSAGRVQGDQRFI